MSKVLELSSENFAKEVLESDLPVLVDFWAPWCAPCRMMAPVLDETAESLQGKLKIAKLNVDDPANQTLAMQYQISSIPNMKFFRGGKAVQDLIGFRPKEALLKDLESLLNK